jgi:type IV pilus assembly protein PilW
MKMTRRQEGFTLIELMIAITLGLLVLAALTTFFVRTSYNRSELERNSRQIENGRYAINALRDDMMLAGYYADVELNAAIWQTPSACPADLTLANAGWEVSALTPKVPVPVFIYPAGVGRPTSCTPDWVTGTDVIVIRRFNTEPIDVAAKVSGIPYVQISECSTDVSPNTPFVFASGSGSGFGAHQKDCVSTNFAKLWRYREQVYYIRNYSVTAGDGIPTLVRRELDASGGSLTMTEVALVEGIENLRVDLGVDTSGDSLPDTWTRCEAAAPCSASDYANVMAAKVYVISKTLEPTREYTDDKTYLLGLSGNQAAANDHYKRHVYSTLIVLPNRTGPREPTPAT